MIRSKDHAKTLSFRAYSAQLTLSFLLALFPAILVLVTVLGFWLDADVVAQQAFGALALVVPTEVLELVKTNIYEALSQRSVAVFSLGFLILIYAIESLVRQLMQVLNAVYEVKEKRSLGERIVLSLLIVAGGLVFSLAIIQLLFVTDGAVALWEAFTGREATLFTASLWRWPLVIGIVWLFVYVSYCFVPNLKKHYWKYQVPGAVFFTLFWLLMSLIFQWYVGNLANYNGTYGLLGVIILTLFYLQLNSYLYIMGGVLNSRIIKAKTRKSIWQKVKHIFRFG